MAERDCPKLDCTDLPNGEYPNPETCTAFCYCVWGESVWTDCPDGLFFNPELKVCDWPQNSGCKIGTESTKPKTGG
ncbi:carbohydrate-binding module family 14 protein [Inquilinus sp. NPDC058860]|uniref:carbohydrate-binding module family 14 protein n=1 Tax=Inquilinus sp. NPDC058860 TaxID=3346652 RepID=UPI0036A32F13